VVLCRGLHCVLHAAERRGLLPTSSGTRSSLVRRRRLRITSSGFIVVSVAVGMCGSRK
jgi:hypothetical protein